MMATIVVPPPNIYSYSITGQGFDPSTGLEVAGSTFNISFSTNGPEEFNAPNNFLRTFSVTGTPAAGWVLDPSNQGLTSYGSDGAAFATFDDTNGDAFGNSSVTYEFFGSDAFWAAPGSNIPFTPATPNAPPAADSGAFFVFNSAGAQSDPPCTNCTVNITGTPEPSSVALLAAVGGIFLLYRRKRRNWLTD
jgi:hypothetical protein